MIFSFLIGVFRLETERLSCLLTCGIGLVGMQVVGWLVVAVVEPWLLFGLLFVVMLRTCFGSRWRDWLSSILKQ